MLYSSRQKFNPENLPKNSLTKEKNISTIGYLKLTFRDKEFLWLGTKTNSQLRNRQKPWIDICAKEDI